MRLHDAASELIGAVCLSLFLTWTMMTLDLSEALRLAGPLLIILAAPDRASRRLGYLGDVSVGRARL